MEDYKINFSKNLIKLRKSINYTQADLAKRLNYSDKAISKWERSESMPDIYMLKEMADFFGVTIDFLLAEHKDEELIQANLQNEDKIKSMHKNHLLIAAVSVLSVWIFAIIAHIILSQLGIERTWLCYIAAIPLSFLIAFIFACIWGRRIQRFFMLSGFTWSLLLFIYLILVIFQKNIWLLFILGVPAQIIELLSFKIKILNKKNKGSK